jgi:hypothetical protein
MERKAGSKKQVEERAGRGRGRERVTRIKE